MPIDLLERPAATVVAHPPIRPATPFERPVAAGVPDRPRYRQWGRWLIALLVLAGATLLALELRHMSGGDLGDIAQRLRPEQVALAAAAIVVSLVAAAYNLTGFSAVRVRLRDSLLVQLGISGVRVVTPSAVSTPLVGARFLMRNGASLTDATATVAVAQIVQLLATIGIVAVLAGTSDVALPPLPGASTLAIVGSVAGVLLISSLVVTRRSPRVRAGLVRLRHSVADLGRHARRHPVRTAGGVAASALLTMAHLCAFAACVAAVGGEVPTLTLAAIYLGAASAGSLLPTPGGVGPVEAAMIGGLTAAGVSLPVATAAALLSRLVAVWLPAVPGWWAVLRLRRAGQL